MNVAHNIRLNHIYTNALEADRPTTTK